LEGRPDRLRFPDLLSVAVVVEDFEDFFDLGFLTSFSSVASSAGTGSATGLDLDFFFGGMKDSVGVPSERKKRKKRGKMNLF
jgi:hypothetical protein